MSDIHIFLYSGKEIIPDFSDGMFRTSVEGNNYCSSTLKGLIDALGFFHSISITTDQVVVPERPLSEKLGEILASTAHLLDRQKAFSRLCSLAVGGDGAAAKIVYSIKGKPVSFGAKVVTQWAGKKDFSEVTSEEISDLVTDIMHRKELLLELSDRVSLKSLMTRSESAIQR